MSATIFVCVGMFDLHCAYSGIALIDDTQLLLLEKSGDVWQPISSPLRGAYDRFGGLDEEDNVSFRSFTEWASKEFGAADIEEAFELMRDGQAYSEGEEVRYSLIDAGVYDALPEVFVEPNPNLPKGLQKRWKEAVANCGPTDVEDSDQYSGLEGEYGCRAQIETALNQFASDPEVVKAIEANALAWKDAEE